MDIEKENFNEINILKEKISCPRCLKAIKISINKYLAFSNGLQTEVKNFYLQEFTKLTCNKCNLEFTFILCNYCNDKIYMRIHPIQNDYNGLNGFNIRCPYKSCNKIFFFGLCPKDHTRIKLNRLIKEGEVINCTNINCNFQYIQVNCPYEKCEDLLWTEKPKKMNSFPFGVIIHHKQEILYQKINCIRCFRPICFPSTKNNQNRYYEGQKVVCPYPDCKASFNRIICIICGKDNYINEGWYEYGTEIKCTECKENFGKILCPECGNLNSFRGRVFKFGKLLCPRENCKKESNIINCLYCRQLNIFQNNLSLIGRRLKCGYCQRTFCKISCPFCSEINFFPYGDFFFGKYYKCQSFNCLKEYQILLCPKCTLFSSLKNNREGQKIQCEKCKTKYMNWGCKFCKLSILAEASTLKIGQLIQCPSPKCRKKYSFMTCWKCEKLIYSEENETIYGRVKQCSNPNCKEYTVMTYCPWCQKRIIFQGQRDINNNETIKCQHCNKNYTFTRQDKLYEGNLLIYEEVEGKKFKFGVGEMDLNYKLKEDLFFSKKIEKNDEESCKYKQINFGECICCHNNLRESVFFPCGHRCACYNCARLYFAAEKKCPKCKKNAICIIKKIYE